MNLFDRCQMLCVATVVAAGKAFAQRGMEQPNLTPLPHPDLPQPVAPAQPSSHWLLILCGVIMVVLFAVVIWLLLRKQILKPATDVPPLTLAHRQLLALLQEMENLAPAEVGHRVSVIVREYQMGRYRVPAPYRTREELYDMREFATDEERQGRFASVALTCDQIAFAPAPATQAEAETLVRSAIEMLRREVFHAEGALPKVESATPAS